MSRIGEKLKQDQACRDLHPDLVPHVESAYIQRRYSGEGLARIAGELNREQLWDRIQDYLHGGMCTIILMALVQAWAAASILPRLQLKPVK